MPTELILTDEDRRDLQYHYNLIRSFPYTTPRENVECAISGHVKSWVKLDSKMSPRKEYSNGPFCERCHKLAWGQYV